ncbi:hypothetical protein EXIGLDRAFT_731053 [Exidia glandulosa HHB12029]|uniref:Uncharacterized protein n=1 Tax=Exidia glandulosa HHB12029 TaxID=1314781 RepID=A0A165L4S7_EXIGL|nr:hypothetical protein EXIGLDRAFT_731053 [Exidia glandulosa HHB12029]
MFWRTILTLAAIWLPRPPPANTPHISWPASPASSSNPSSATPPQAQPGSEPTLVDYWNALDKAQVEESLIRLAFLLSHPACWAVLAALARALQNLGARIAGRRRRLVKVTEVEVEVEVEDANGTVEVAHVDLIEVKEEQLVNGNGNGHAHHHLVLDEPDADADVATPRAPHVLQLPEETVVEVAPTPGPRTVLDRLRAPLTSFISLFADPSPSPLVSTREAAKSLAHDDDPLTLNTVGGPTPAELEAVMSRTLDAGYNGLDVTQWSSGANEDESPLVNGFDNRAIAPLQHSITIPPTSTTSTSLDASLIDLSSVSSSSYIVTSSTELERVAVETEDGLVVQEETVVEAGTLEEMKTPQDELVASFVKTNGLMDSAVLVSSEDEDGTPGPAPEIELPSETAPAFLVAAKEIGVERAPGTPSLPSESMPDFLTAARDDEPAAEEEEEKENALPQPANSNAPRTPTFVRAVLPESSPDHLQPTASATPGQFPDLQSPFTEDEQDQAGSPYTMIDAPSPSPSADSNVTETPTDSPLLNRGRAPSPDSPSPSYWNSQPPPTIKIPGGGGGGGGREIRGRKRFSAPPNLSNVVPLVPATSISFSSETSEGRLGDEEAEGRAKRRSAPGLERRFSGGGGIGGEEGEKRGRVGTEEGTWMRPGVGVRPMMGFADTGGGVPQFGAPAPVAEDYDDDFEYDDEEDEEEEDDAEYDDDLDGAELDYGGEVDTEQQPLRIVNWSPADGGAIPEAEAEEGEEDVDVTVRPVVNLPVVVEEEPAEALVEEEVERFADADEPQIPPVQDEDEPDRAEREIARTPPPATNDDIDIEVEEPDERPKHLRPEVPRIAITLPHGGEMPRIVLTPARDTHPQLWEDQTGGEHENEEEIESDADEEVARVMGVRRVEIPQPENLVVNGHPIESPTIGSFPLSGSEGDESLLDETAPAPAEEGAVDDAVPEPKEEESTPAVEPTVEEPVVEEATAEESAVVVAPAVEKPVPEEVAEEAAPQPADEPSVVEEPIPEPPVVEESVAEPAIEESTPEVVAEVEPVSEAAPVEEAAPDAMPPADLEEQVVDAPEPEPEPTPEPESPVLVDMPVDESVMAATANTDAAADVVIAESSAHVEESAPVDEVVMSSTANTDAAADAVIAESAAKEQPPADEAIMASTANTDAAADAIVADTTEAPAVDEAPADEVVMAATANTDAAADAIIAASEKEPES